MKQLYAEGKLTPAQQLFMAPRKPEEAVSKEMRVALGQWMRECRDVEAVPGEPR